MGFEEKQFQNDRTTSSTGIPFFGGRPDRDIAIGHEDITNLIIALNTTNDVTDFLAVI